jgi:hypothetical protein
VTFPPSGHDVMFDFPSDFRPLSSERIPGNCLLLSAGFGLPLWFYYLSYGLGLFSCLGFCVAFEVFQCFGLVPSFLMCFPSLPLSDTSFVFFPFSFLFAFTIVLVQLVPFLPFPFSLHFFGFSVCLPGLFVLSAKKIIPAFAPLRLCNSKRPTR